MRETDASGQVKAILTGTSCAYQRQEGQAQRPVFSIPRLRDIEPAISIQAITDCTVAIIDYRDMDELLSRPTLASAIWRASMLEAAAYRARLSSTSRGTALEQVAHLLCEQLAHREAVGALGPQLPFSQVVADATGLSVVHVNRTIQTLRGLNVLSKATRAIEVVDREQLTKIAGFDGRYLTMSTLASR